jgi:hypothetical protein
MRFFSPNQQMTFCNYNNNNYISRYEPSSPPIHITNNVEQIIPQVFLSSDWPFWSTDNLRHHGISHIININNAQRPLSATITKSEDINLPDCVAAALPTSSDDCIDLTEFECLDLDFAEIPFLTAVLPNCYKAVKFLDKALNNSGTVLFKEKNGKQKSLTVTIAYLMYKYKFNYE